MEVREREWREYPEELDRRELQEQVYCGRLSVVESFNEGGEVVREQWRLAQGKQIEHLVSAYMVYTTNTHI